MLENETVLDIPETALFVVVCHTEDCENAEIPIGVIAEISGSFVVCGPCSMIVTDVVLAEAKVEPYAPESNAVTLEVLNPEGTP
jgi:hypothetical protein